MDARDANRVHGRSWGGELNPFWGESAQGKCPEQASDCKCGPSLSVEWLASSAGGLPQSAP
jgi:hypothetical protein